MHRLRPETLLLPGPGGAARVPRPLRAVVVGGGIAGLSAAAVLVERGVRVTLLEREPGLGGRAGSFETILPTGERVHMERGFHGFFRQYYTLRALLRRADPELSMLRALEDYPVLGPAGLVQSFRDLPTRTPLQVIAVAARTPHLRARDLLRADARAALQMLAFDPERTYARFDPMTAEQYLRSLALPDRARQMLFDVFAHSFFNPEAEMSAAELLMMFHFYFTGNPEGLVFDVAREPLGPALWQPLGRWLAERGAEIAAGTCAERAVRAAAGGWAVEHSAGRSQGELLVLALDVAGLQGLVQRSPDLAPLQASVRTLEPTRPFAVWRLWLDRKVSDARAPFAGTTGIGLLDNVSVYERLQGESAAWARDHGGSVVELHAYALPPGISEAHVRADLLAGLHAMYPETRAARIVHDCYLERSDCPAFAPGAHAHRPAVQTALPDVALAGDGIAVPVPCALMERAAVSGVLAANTLLARFGVAAEPIACVSRRGLLAPAGPSVRLVGRRLAPRPPLDLRPDCEQASSAWIHRALQRALSLPAGGWYALDASRAIGERPRCYRVQGRALVVWRDAQGIVAAPEACPHLGASLAGARVQGGALICPWHGLRLGREGRARWRPAVGHDDGVLFWVRLPDEAELTAAPVLAARPAQPLCAVVRTVAACEPRDVIANRLDPWHGVHYHPHSFARLHVVEQDEHAITVRVAYRLAGPVAVEVDARFHCPDPRTIVMTIVRGEGEGSIVETHATPLSPGRTAIVEAVLATSERRGFALARALAPALRPMVRWAARRLWKEDAAYVERLYALRRRERAGNG